VQRRAETDALCERVAGAMTAAGYGCRDVFAVRLALEEAVANAIKHGHQGDVRKKVRVSYCVDSERTLARVTDEGPGFDPEDVADPLEPENLERSSGRGLLLMRHYMTWVRFNERGNCVRLCKRRTH
jgi:serine/threonine-protein kinase RsbW